MQPRDPEFRYLSSREPLKCAQSLTQRGTPAEFFLVIHMFPSLPRFFVPSFTEVADSDGDGRFFFFADFAAALAIVFVTAFATFFLPGLCLVELNCLTVSLLENFGGLVLGCIESNFHD